LQNERSPLPLVFNEGNDHACAAAIEARSIRKRGMHAPSDLIPISAIGHDSDYRLLGSV
jgi:hypothetical protein